MRTNHEETERAFCLHSAHSHAHLLKITVVHSEKTLMTAKGKKKERENLMMI